MVVEETLGRAVVSAETANLTEVVDVGGGEASKTVDDHRVEAVVIDVVDEAVVVAGGVSVEAGSLIEVIDPKKLLYAWGTRHWLRCVGVDHVGELTVVVHEPKVIAVGISPEADRAVGLLMPVTWVCTEPGKFSS